MAPKGPELAFVTGSGIENIEMRDALMRSRNADNRADSRKKTVSELVCMISVYTSHGTLPKSGQRHIGS